MNLADRVRLERAVWSYSFWLDVRCVTWRRRRQLRAELRANLHDAAERTDARTAVSGLGSIRAMAADAVPFDSTRPRWSVGVQAGFAALALTVAIEFFAALAWMDGVMAAGPDADRVVSGSLTLYPGSLLEFEQQAKSFSLSFQPGWGVLVVGVLVLVVVARPWRLWTRRARDRQLTPA